MARTKIGVARFGEVVDEDCGDAEDIIPNLMLFVIFKRERNT